MFSADLSWTDGTVEKVGERKKRKERERVNSISGSSFSSSGQQRKSSSKRVSISDASSLSSATGSISNPTLSRIASLRKRTASPADSAKLLRDPFKEHPIVRPFVQSPVSRRSPSLDNGLSPWVPYTELDGDIPGDNESTLSTLSTFNSPLPSDRSSSRSEFGHHWSISANNDAYTFWSSYQQTAEKMIALKASRPGTYSSNTSSLKVCLSEAPAEEEEKGGDVVEHPILGKDGNLAWPNQMDIQAMGDFYLSPTRVEDLSAILQTVTITVSTDPMVEGETLLPTPTTKKDNLSPYPTSSDQKSQWQAPSEWEIARDDKESPGSDLDSTQDKTPMASPKLPAKRILSNDSTTLTAEAASRFQEFVRQIEERGLNVLLDRLREDWSDAFIDASDKEELTLEKHLWALTALQLDCIADQFSRVGMTRCLIPGTPLPPVLQAGKRRKILELDGAIGEIYQLSAMYPDSKIDHLLSHSTKSKVTIPSQARQKSLKTAAPTTSPFLPLPYASSSMHHIRSSRLATLIPSSQIPQLLAECHRVLKPGGVLELRVMDAAPQRQCLGPNLAAWLEERLLVGLEAKFRCSRPLALVPQWAKQAGFVPMASTVHEFERPDSLKRSGVVRCLRLPAAMGRAPLVERTGVLVELGLLLSRTLWKDTWGSYVADVEGDSRWWWDSDMILSECADWGTVFEVATLVVVKEG